MRGIPKRIQTRADLNNLFNMAMAGDPDIPMAALAVRVRALLATQYRAVPILSAEGASVTTHYFPEAVKNAATEDGLTIKNVSHIEDPEDANQFATTVITLSKAPNDSQVLSVYMEDNFLVQHGFDVAEINYIMGVLENAETND